MRPIRRIMARMSDLRAIVDELSDRIRPHYSRFLAGRDEQCLLTGHSHQAWPDISREAQLACWDDAATLVDGKWGKVLGEVLPEFQAQVTGRLGAERPQDLCLAPNTHELVYRLASCFPSDGRVVTSDSEFHSLRRQLTRLAEDGLQVTRVPVEGEGGPETFAERFCAALESQRPDWCAVSQVFFTTSRVLTDLPAILQTAAALGIPALVDTYHAYNVIEIEAAAWPGTVFVTGGGYKYAQTGEGACWLHLPADASAFRPRTTGWFADFANLEAPPEAQVTYAQDGFRFMGATFDPSGLYRGVWTQRWMDQLGLTPERLQAHARASTQHLVDRYDELDLAGRGVELASPRDPAARGAFVSLRTPKAVSLSASLREAGVHTDARGDLLRFGPAPYTQSRELDQGIETLLALL